MGYLSLSDAAVGRRGEILAATFLTKQGYEVVARNLTFSVGEIDLLCQDGTTLVVVEVKTSRRLTVHPLVRINALKRRKLWLLGQLIATHYPDTNIRFDSVTVYWDEQGKPTMQHLQNILESDNL